ATRRNDEDRPDNRSGDDEHAYEPGAAQMQPPCGFHNRRMEGRPGRCPENDRLIVVRRESRQPHEYGSGHHQRQDPQPTLSAPDERRTGPDRKQRREIEEVAILNELVGREPQVERRHLEGQERNEDEDEPRGSVRAWSFGANSRR